MGCYTQAHWHLGIPTRLPNKGIYFSRTFPSPPNVKSCISQFSLPDALHKRRHFYTEARVPLLLPRVAIVTTRTPLFPLQASNPKRKKCAWTLPPLAAAFLPRACSACRSRAHDDFFPSISPSLSQGPNKQPQQTHRFPATIPSRLCGWCCLFGMRTPTTLESFRFLLLSQSPLDSEQRAVTDSAGSRTHRHAGSAKPALDLTFQLCSRGLCS